MPVCVYLLESARLAQKYGAAGEFRGREWARKHKQRSVSALHVLCLGAQQETLWLVLTPQRTTFTLLFDLSVCPNTPG